MSRFNLAFNPAAFAQAARKHRLILKSHTDAQRARIPQQLLQIKRLAGAYSIHLFGSTIDGEQDRIMGNIMWNELLDSDTRTLCGDIGSQEVPLFSHIVQSLESIAALDRPFREFIRRLKESPWTDRQGRSPSKTLATKTMGSFRHDMLDLFDLYCSLASSLHTRLQGFVTSVAQGVHKERQEADVKEGMPATKAKEAYLRSMEAYTDPATGNPVVTHDWVSLRKIISDFDSNPDEGKAAVEAYFSRHAAAALGTPAPVGGGARIKDRVTSRQVEDARVKGVILGCLDRHHIVPGSLYKGTPQLCNSWKNRITLLCAPRWVSDEIYYLGGELDRKGTWEQLMDFITQLVREVDETDSAAYTPPHGSLGSLTSGSGGSNPPQPPAAGGKTRRGKGKPGRSPDSNRPPPTSSVPTNPSTPRPKGKGKPQGQPPSPGMCWDRQLAQWRPRIPDDKWNDYVYNMSIQQKRELVAQLPLPSQGPSSSSAASSATPTSTAQDRNTSGQQSGSRARPRRPGTTHYPNRYKDTQTYRRGGKDSKYNSKTPKSESTFSPSSGPTFNALADEYQSEAEATSDSEADDGAYHPGAYVLSNHSQPASESAEAEGVSLPNESRVASWTPDRPPRPRGVPLPTDMDIDWDLYARVYTGGDLFKFVSIWQYYLKMGKAKHREQAVRTHRPTTMVVRLLIKDIGTLGVNRLLALVDTGCSYSLISSNMASQLRMLHPRWTSKSFPTIRLRTASSQYVTSSAVLSVQFAILGSSRIFTWSFYVTETSGLDVILGQDWMTADWVIPHPGVGGVYWYEKKRWRMVLGSPKAVVKWARQHAPEAVLSPGKDLGSRKGDSVPPSMVS